MTPLVLFVWFALVGCNRVDIELLTAASRPPAADGGRPSDRTYAPPDAGSLPDATVGDAATVDLCPEDDRKLSPGMCGCGVPDRDSDADGVCDAIDRCKGRDVAGDIDLDGICDTEFPAGWTAMGNMPKVLGGIAIARLSDGLHVLGGGTIFDGSQRSQVHYRYDAISDEWTDAPASIPDDNTWGVQAQVYEDKLYLLGGWPQGDFYFRRYNPADNRWERLADLPARFSYGYASAVVDNFLYILGGRDGATTNAACYRYNFSTQQWTPIAAIPLNHGNGALSAASWERKIYVINGDQAGGATVLQIYDVDSNSWSSGPGLAAHHEGAAGAAAYGKLYFFGGSEAVYRNGGAVRDTVNVYDIATKTWSTAEAMSAARSRLAAIAANGGIYVFGGFLGNGDATSTYDVFGL